MTTMPRPQEGTPTTGLTPPTQRGFSSRLIGDVVVDLGFATREDVDIAVAEGRATGTATGQVLVQSGTISADELSRVLAERFGLDHVDLMAYNVDLDASRLVPATVARRHEAIPIGFGDDGTLLVAMADPSNVLAVDDIALLTGQRVRPTLAAPDDITLLIGRVAGAQHAVTAQSVADAAAGEDGYNGSFGGEDLAESADDAPVVRVVHSLIQQAIERGASDVHLAPQGDGLHCHLRIDGVLVETASVPATMAPSVIARIKIMAELDIAERRAPQDGRMGVAIDGRTIDIRVVSLPLVGGESVVLRILDRRSGTISLDELGMPEHAVNPFIRACRRSHGAVLVTGPTGSGKTTSLYAALQTVNSGERSILTIEDPVEYRIDGIKQMQVNPKAGLSFATGLRSILRADPDVVMVGEIRDRDTAQIAVEAALTGHLVLSTLHTNDAPTAATRLIEMGIEPFLVASAVECVVAQRLARRLCDDCRVPVKIPAAALVAAGLDAGGAIDAYEADGCPRCGGTGYRGRIGLYEVMPMTEDVRGLILERAPAATIGAAACAQGMRYLREDGLDKVLAGVTSLKEIARVTGG
jgi:type IV pilus assembly protein PilB